MSSYFTLDRELGQCYTLTVVKIRKTKMAEENPEQVAEIKALIEKLAALLGYDDTWRFNLVCKKLSNKTLAMCACEPEYRLVEIGVDLRPLLDGEDMKKTLVHEMMHVHMWPIYQLMDRISSLLPEHYSELNEAMRQNEEAAATFLEHAPMWKELLK